MTEREERAKAWLNRNYGIALEIQAIQRRLERMNADLEKVTRPLKIKEVIEANNPGNAQEDRLADYIDMSDDLEQRLEELNSLDMDTLEVINRIEFPTLRSILIERYVNRLSWKQICEATHYERTWVWDLHRQALCAVMPYIPEEAMK